MGSCAQEKERTFVKPRKDQGTNKSNQHLAATHKETLEGEEVRKQCPQKDLG